MPAAIGLLIAGYGLKKNLELLGTKVLENKNNPQSEFGVYFSYMYQGTNNKKARVVRSNTFKKYIL